MQRWNQPDTSAIPLLYRKVPALRKLGGVFFLGRLTVYTLSVTIRVTSTPANMKNSPVASPTAFQVGHLLNRYVRSAFGTFGGVLPGVNEDLGPSDERQRAEDLRLDLDGDIEILSLQQLSRLCDRIPYLNHGVDTKWDRTCRTLALRTRLATDETD